MNATARLFADARQTPADDPLSEEAFAQAIADISLQKALAAKEERAREVALDMLTATVEHDDRLDEALMHLMRRDVFIVAAVFLGVSALYIALDDIHIALPMIVVASLFAWRAVVNHRRAETLHPFVVPGSDA